MSNARRGTLTNLRQAIGRLEAGSLQLDAARVGVGHPGADMVLHGGLMRNALHEVFASESRQAASTTAFVAGLAWRCAAQRPVMWVQQDFVAREVGAVSMNGCIDLGLDPRRIVTVRAADIDMALRVTADALSCKALGAVVLDIWGVAPQLDLVANRKLTLASQVSGVPCFILRTSAQPSASTAETRWIVQAAHSPPGSVWSAWGTPLFDVQLVRNRHGLTGRWIMEWNCNECIFREPPSYPQPAPAASSNRSAQAPTVAQRCAS